MDNNSSRFDLEWWVVQKRLIYSIITILVLGAGAVSATAYVWKYGFPFSTDRRDVSAPAGARFVSFDGDVRVVRANTRETIPASSNTQLYPGDIVQTQTDGRARITLIDGSTLVVRPNSVVQIRDNTSGEGGRRTNVLVGVDRGQINVHTEQQTEGTNNVVETRLTKNRLGAQTGVSFGVREDNSEDIRVNTGSIETATRSGEKTTVRGGEYLAINQTGNIARRERLIDAPKLMAPRDLEKITVKADGTTNVTLRWQRPSSGSLSHYRVEVATSPFFVAAGKVVERDQLDATVFDVSNLRPGVYFWRVMAVATSGQESEWSEPQKFTIALGSTGERIAVSGVSFEYVAGNIYIVRGRSQPGNTIRMAGRETITKPDGSFQLQITALKGTREIIAEVEDQQGNKNRQQLAFSPDAAQR